MLNWFKGHKHSKYREILLNAFPRTLNKDVESVLDILPFEVNDVKLYDGQIHKVEKNNCLQSKTRNIISRQKVE